MTSRRDSYRLPLLPPRVLILDDEVDALERREHMLRESYEMRVVTARTVEQAMRVLRTFRGLDLIIADVNLEGAEHNDVSGADFAAQAYEFDPSIPIIIYSGVVGEGSLTQRHRFAMRRFVHKTSNVADLEAELDAAVRQAQEHRLALATRAEKLLGRLREGHALPIQDMGALKAYVPGCIADSAHELRLLSEGYQLAVADFEDTPSLLYWWRVSPSSPDEVDVEVLGHEYLNVSGSSRLHAIERLVGVLTAFHHLLGTVEAKPQGTAARLADLVHGMYSPQEWPQGESIAKGTYG
jgi:CheY-like chemotaxis protein